MTASKWTDIRQQYSGNSGDPTVVFGISGSGGHLSGAYSGFVREYIDTHYRGISATGSLASYTVSSFAVETPGAISESTKSPEQIAFEKRKARLIAAVNVMKQSAPNWSGSAASVNDLSAQNAEKFLQALPGNALLPRVAPDGEGDIMFVWDGPQTCVVTVEKRALHLACQLGTPQEQHIAQQRFLGVRIPTAILDLIPSK
jgi:hypothetical protein